MLVLYNGHHHLSLVGTIYKPVILGPDYCECLPNWALDRLFKSDVGNKNRQRKR